MIEHNVPNIGVLNVIGETNVGGRQTFSNEDIYPFQEFPTNVDMNISEDLCSSLLTPFSLIDEIDVVNSAPATTNVNNAIISSSFPEAKQQNPEDFFLQVTGADISTNNNSVNTQNFLIGSGNTGGGSGGVNGSLCYSYDSNNFNNKATSNNLSHVYYNNNSNITHQLCPNSISDYAGNVNADEIIITDVGTNSDTSTIDFVNEDDLENGEEPFTYLQGLNSDNLMQFSQQSAIHDLLIKECDIKPNLYTLPTLEEHDFAGYEFSLQIPESRKLNWVFSQKLNKIYIKMNQILNMEIFFKPKIVSSSNIRLRVFMCFVKEVSEPIIRCQNHVSRDLDADSLLPHLLRCDNPGVEYSGSVAGKSINERFAVLVPMDVDKIPKKPNECQTIRRTVALKFTCQNSCMGRKETCLVFLLENANGEVFSQRVVEVKICSCPKRDRDVDEAVKRRLEEAVPIKVRTPSITINDIVKEEICHSADEFCLGPESGDENTKSSIFSYKPTLRTLPTFEEHDQGGYNFHLRVTQQPLFSKTNWVYSERLNKVYIRMNQFITINTVVTPKIPIQPLKLRIFLCFTKEISEPVTRCQNHYSKDIETPIHLRHCLLRCDNPLTEYCGSAEGKTINERYSVLVPISMKQPPQDDGSIIQSIVLKFTCQNSCLGRRETCLIFLLESTNGEILAQRNLDIRICSSPKRDRDLDTGVKRKSDDDSYIRPTKIRKRISMTPNDFSNTSEEEFQDIDSEEEFRKEFNIFSAPRSDGEGVRVVMEFKDKSYLQRAVDSFFTLISDKPFEGQSCSKRIIRRARRLRAMREQALKL